MDMTNAEIIHDLEAIKKSFMEQTNGCYPISLEAAINIIQNIDHIQTELDRARSLLERPQGKWIRISAKAYKCKDCNYVTDIEYPYCPVCGTDMREDSENGQ